METAHLAPANTNETITTKPNQAERTDESHAAVTLRDRLVSSDSPAGASLLAMRDIKEAFSFRDSNVLTSHHTM